jgi:metal-dependent amidase/aminoacylase/carboxypeptidase family protein
MQEAHTADLILERLNRLGLVTFLCGGTGVVGILRNDDGPVVGYRADTDGLPVAEETGLDYSSEKKRILADGTEVPVMHGCGHDTHITMGLTVARLLGKDLHAWVGTVVFIFQPGDEIRAGPEPMVNDGLRKKVPKLAII